MIPAEPDITREMERHGLDRMQAIRRIQQRQALRARNLHQIRSTRRWA